MVVLAKNSSTGEMELGGSVQGYPQLHIEFKVSTGYWRPCLKNRFSTQYE